jgi:hypothetical protein
LPSKNAVRRERDGIVRTARCRRFASKQQRANRQQAGGNGPSSRLCASDGRGCRFGGWFVTSKPHRAQRNQEPSAYFGLISVEVGD